MDTKTIVSSRGQIVIPKFLRDSIGLHSGSQLSIHLRADHVIELQAVQQHISLFFGQGALHIKNQLDISPLDVDQAIEQAVSANFNLEPNTNV